MGRKRFELLKPSELPEHHCTGELCCGVGTRCCTNHTAPHGHPTYEELTMPTTVKKKAKELERGDRVERFSDQHREEVHVVLGVSEAMRRHGQYGDWVYRVRLRNERGREWTSVISARDSFDVLVD